MLRTALVARLQLRPPAPLDAGMILLAWLRRPTIEMPMIGEPAYIQRGTDHGAWLRRRLDDVFPF